jgi:hypothetical protein
MTVGCVKKNTDTKDKDCLYAKSFAMSDINNGNLTLYLTDKKYLLINNYVKYFIWKKYNVNIDGSYAGSSLTKTDSCYFETMKQHVLKYREILNDIDSISLLKLQPEEPEIFVYFYKFHDGKYDIMLCQKSKKYLPIPKDSLFDYKLDSLIGSFSSEIDVGLKCEFWYDIDIQGNVQNIEIITHSTPEIDNEIISFFKSTKFRPANNGKKNIEYRGLEILYINSETKKNKKSILSSPIPIE